MRYPTACSCLILSMLFLLSFGANGDISISAPVPEKGPPADVLILHDSLPGSLPPGVIDGNNILDLLGHFGLKGTLASIEDYRPGDLNRYRFVIVLGVDIRKAEYPSSLIANIRSTKLPVFWIGNHFPDLISDPQVQDGDFGCTDVPGNVALQIQDGKSQRLQSTRHACTGVVAGQEEWRLPRCAPNREGGVFAQARAGTRCSFRRRSVSRATRYGWQLPEHLADAIPPFLAQRAEIHIILLEAVTHADFQSVALVTHEVDGHAYRKIAAHGGVK